ncbi:MAG TPA: hypothetical protein DEP84_06935 [Chloroflexi bacterium]|nr:hypothetical protein [Chloroflexota bacterium]
MGMLLRKDKNLLGFQAIQTLDDLPQCAGALLLGRDAKDNEDQQQGWRPRGYSARVMECKRDSIDRRAQIQDLAGTNTIERDRIMQRV